MQQLLEATKSAAATECAKEVLEGIPPVTWFIRRQMRSHRGGLSLAQFRSLVRANRPPAASLTDIAEHLGASLPTTSRIVTGMVQKGLMSRRPCRWDRRQVLLELSPRGKAMLQTARKATQQRMELELHRLTPQERTTVVAAMEILKGVFAPSSK
jgi:DNA-binding MarR family transcriptional regulator